MKENGKTYVYDKHFNFLKAFPTKVEAVIKTRKKDCFYFSQKEIKQQKHIKLFKELDKHQTSPLRKVALAALLVAKKRAKK